MDSSLAVRMALTRFSGTVVCGENTHVRMCRYTGSHSRTKIPPPLLLRGIPREPPSVSIATHPWFNHWWGSYTKQFFASRIVMSGMPVFLSGIPIDVSQDPVIVPTGTSNISHPFLVWSAVFASDWQFTPSTISISPFTGQFASSVSQKAGHVPQPDGMCRTSMINNPRLNRFFPSNRMDSLGPASVAAVDRYKNGSILDRLVFVVGLPSSSSASPKILFR
mmetsp:Transcript_23794/g.50604  ORF Transcript_23794/g.50604 Transcript_23794/m.50604 type:complete len:221 (-) Transcript_23794:996-1658(-)